MTRFQRITVHGRFQPPLHMNHWQYVKTGFDLADFVTVLITNPFQDEIFEASASWRNVPENNPFSYEERIQMFADFFAAQGIDSSRYEFKPFNIKQDESFKELDAQIPNLVNVYSEWSAKKVELFERNGLKVIKLEEQKTVPVSGTIIRELIRLTKNLDELPKVLIDAGFVADAVPGLLKVLKQKKNIGELN